MSRLWSAAATGATPYAEAAGLYSSANGRLRFAPGRIGTAYFVCSVENVSDLASVRHLAITYRDAGRRQSDQGEVSAVLKKVSYASGGIDNILGISSVSKPTGDAWTTAQSVRLDDSEVPLDDTSHYYYVVITLRRDDAEDQNPTVLGVYLDAGV